MGSTRVTTSRWKDLQANIFSWMKDPFGANGQNTWTIEARSSADLSRQSWHKTWKDVNFPMSDAGQNSQTHYLDLRDSTCDAI